MLQLVFQFAAKFLLLLLPGNRTRPGVSKNEDSIYVGLRFQCPRFEAATQRDTEAEKMDQNTGS